MAKRGSKKTTSPTILQGALKTKVLAVMDCLGGDNHSYYELDNVKLGGERSKIKFQMKVLVKKSNRELATRTVLESLKNKKIVSVRDGYRIEIPMNPADAGSGEKIRLDIKPIGSGSGGGSDETAKNESTQALFCALRWSRNQDLNKNNWSISDLESVLSNCDINPTNLWNNDLEQLLMVDPTWYDSHIKGANLIYKKINNTSKTYTFHRGSDLVDKIQKTFSECDKAYPEGKNFSDVNKWTPADIWIVSNDFISKELSKLTACRSLEQLNQMIEEYFDSKDLMGISLKKIENGDGNWSVKNHKDIPKDVSEVYYRGMEGTFESIDFYIKWGSNNEDRIQFRDSSGKAASWQGEIKGLSAAQGRIGGGIVDGYIQKLFKGKSIGVKSGNVLIKNKTNPNNSNSRQRISISKDIFDLTKKVKSNVLFKDFADDDQTLADIGRESHSWRYSKYINLKLIEVFNTLNPEQKTKLVRAWYFYAASQSELSAVYAKVM
jgi:hypothetical protein